MLYSECNVLMTLVEKEEPLITEVPVDGFTELISKNEGITCVGFMGGDQDPLSVTHLAQYIKDEYPDFLVPKKLVSAIYRYVGALRVK